MKPWRLRREVAANNNATVSELRCVRTRGMIGGDFFLFREICRLRGSCEREMISLLAPILDQAANLGCGQRWVHIGIDRLDGGCCSLAWCTGETGLPPNLYTRFANPRSLPPPSSARPLSHLPPSCARVLQYISSAHITLGARASS